MTCKFDFLAKIAYFAVYCCCFYKMRRYGLRNYYYLSVVLKPKLTGREVYFLFEMVLVIIKYL